MLGNLHSWGPYVLTASTKLRSKLANPELGMAERVREGFPVAIPGKNILRKLGQCGHSVVLFLPVRPRTSHFDYLHGPLSKAMTFHLLKPPGSYKTKTVVIDVLYHKQGKTNTFP